MDILPIEKDPAAVGKLLEINSQLKKIRHNHKWSENVCNANRKLNVLFENFKQSTIASSGENTFL